MDCARPGDGSARECAQPAPWLSGWSAAPSSGLRVGEQHGQGELSPTLPLGQWASPRRPCTRLRAPQREDGRGELICRSVRPHPGQRWRMGEQGMPPASTHHRQFAEDVAWMASGRVQAYRFGGLPRIQPTGPAGGSTSVGGFLQPTSSIRCSSAGIAALRHPLSPGSRPRCSRTRGGYLNGPRRRASSPSV